MTGPAPELRPPGGSGGRLASLDVLRGATIAAMLLVNNPGSWMHVYPPLRHAEWHGWTPTDLIFPFFVFIMGTAMAFSLRRQKVRGEKDGEKNPVARRTIRRAIVLVALGLLLNGFPGYELSSLRIPGVLQRLGLVYAIAVPAVLLLRPAARFGFAFVILLGWWATLMLVPVEGVAPAMEPTRNLQRAVDLAIFGEAHVWQGSATDPEGLLGTFSAVVTCLMGYWAGVFLREKAQTTLNALRLAAAGALIAAVGQLWAIWLPVNKALWTPSFVLLSGGLAMVGLAACLWWVDIRKLRWTTRPFEAIGLNAIVIFVGAGMSARLLAMIKIGDYPEAPIVKTFAFDEMVFFGVPPRLASLLLALGFVFAWWVVAWILMKWRIIIRV